MLDRFEKEMVVHEVSEDSDAWFVSRPEPGQIPPENEDARAAVDAWLVETVGDDAETLALCRETLAATKPRRGSWWFATGHSEGEMVNIHTALPPRVYMGVLFR